MSNWNIDIATQSLGHSPQFVGRSRELQTAWQALSSGRDVALFGARGSGKTALLYRLREGGSERGTAVAFVNASTAQTPAEFVSLLYKAAKSIPSAEVALKEVTRKLKAGISGVSAVEISLSGLKLEFEKEKPQTWDWKAAGEILVNSIEMLPTPTILIVDEFDYFVNNLDARTADEFLHWFRAVREAKRARNGARWIVTADRRLEYKLRQSASRYAFHDLEHLHLGPFDLATADQHLYVNFAQSGLEASPEVRRYMIEQLGSTFPYHLNLLGSLVSRLSSEKERAVTREVVDTAFQELVSDQGRYLPMLMNIVAAQVGKDDFTYAQEVLRMLAQHDDGIAAERLEAALKKATKVRPVNLSLEEILEILESERIVARVEGKLRIQFRPLQLRLKKQSLPAAK